MGRSDAPGAHQPSKTTTPSRRIVRSKKASHPPVHQRQWKGTNEGPDVKAVAATYNVANEFQLYFSGYVPTSLSQQPTAGEWQERDTTYSTGIVARKVETSNRAATGAMLPPSGVPLALSFPSQFPQFTNMKESQTDAPRTAEQTNAARLSAPDKWRYVPYASSTAFRCKELMMANVQEEAKDEYAGDSADDDELEGNTEEASHHRRSETAEQKGVVRQESGLKTPQPSTSPQPKRRGSCSSSADGAGSAVGAPQGVKGSSGKWRKVDLSLDADIVGDAQRSQPVLLSPSSVTSSTSILNASIAFRQRGVGGVAAVKGRHEVLLSQFVAQVHERTRRTLSGLAVKTAPTVQVASASPKSSGPRYSLMTTTSNVATSSDPSRPREHQEALVGLSSQPLFDSLDRTPSQVLTEGTPLGGEGGGGGPSSTAHTSTPPSAGGIGTTTSSSSSGSAGAAPPVALIVPISRQHGMTVEHAPTSHQQRQTQVQFPRSPMLSRRAVGDDTTSSSSSLLPVLPPPPPISAVHLEFHSHVVVRADSADQGMVRMLLLIPHNSIVKLSKRVLPIGAVCDETGARAKEEAGIPRGNPLFAVREQLRSKEKKAPTARNVLEAAVPWTLATVPLVDDDSVSVLDPDSDVWLTDFKSKSVDHRSGQLLHSPTSTSSGGGGGGGGGEGDRDHSSSANAVSVIDDVVFLARSRDRLWIVPSSEEGGQQPPPPNGSRLNTQEEALPSKGSQQSQKLRAKVRQSRQPASEVERLRMQLGEVPTFEADGRVKVSGDAYERGRLGSTHDGWEYHQHPLSLPLPPPPPPPPPQHQQRQEQEEQQTFRRPQTAAPVTDPHTATERTDALDLSPAVDNRPPSVGREELPVSRSTAAQRRHQSTQLATPLRATPRSHARTAQKPKESIPSSQTPIQEPSQSKKEKRGNYGEEATEGMGIGQGCWSEAVIMLEVTPVLSDVVIDMELMLE